MIFTRYLYEKSYVEYSLFLALLKQNTHEALFWAFELYFSGFQEDAFALIWKYYYSMYAAFHVRLEKFLLRKTHKWLENTDDYSIFGSIVITLASKQPCIDIYYMMHDMSPFPEFLRPWVEQMYPIDVEIDDYMNSCGGLLDNFIDVHRCYISRGKPIVGITNDSLNLPFVNHEIVRYACISRMFSGLFLLDKNNGFDPSFYINMSRQDCKQYLTPETVRMKAWKVPIMHCIYAQKISPDKEPLTIGVYQQWLQYAWHSPLWRRRIHDYGGELHEDGNIGFASDDDADDFFDTFDLEPDEQSKDILNKWFGEKPYVSWKQLHDEYTLDVLHWWFDKRLELCVS